MRRARRRRRTSASAWPSSSVRAEPGGAAVHTGTLPSKTLRETALFLSGYRQRELYGIKVELDRALAVPRLMSRKDACVGLEVARIRWNLERHDVDYLRRRRALRRSRTRCEFARSDGDAHASPPSSSWSPPARAPFQPHEHPLRRPATSTTATPSSSSTALPETHDVIGGGVIGCEYASMFAAMGVKVHARREPRPRFCRSSTPRLATALRQAHGRARHRRPARGRACDAAWRASTRRGIVTAARPRASEHRVREAPLRRRAQRRNRGARPREASASRSTSAAT